jgi:hypothetical protein
MGGQDGKWASSHLARPPFLDRGVDPPRIGLVLRLSGPYLAVVALCCVACAGDTSGLRREVATLRADVERLERANVTQGQRFQQLAEHVAGLQGPSPMVVVAPPVVPTAPARAAPLPAVAAPAHPAREPLVPRDLQVVRVEPEREPEPIVLESSASSRSRKRAPPPVPTAVKLVEPQGALQ